MPLPNSFRPRAQEYAELLSSQLNRATWGHRATDFGPQRRLWGRPRRLVSAQTKKGSPKAEGAASRDRHKGVRAGLDEPSLEDSSPGGVDWQLGRPLHVRDVGKSKFLNQSKNLSFCGLWCLGQKPLGSIIPATPQAMPSDLFVLCGLVAGCGSIHLLKSLSAGASLPLSQGLCC